MSKLTIVIPALNEEAAIGSTIERCLAAKSEICTNTGVEDVEIIVVSDGSTDRTAEIAQSYDGVKVIVFPRNRGYGAAIKEGFARGTGDLVAFLDADGTCDPRFFATLCRIVQETHADVALGSRLGPGSQMPTIRRVGNRVYAVLLGVLCGNLVTDTASGMRVIRRSSLDDLYPLPDGLHFTPAMSARALLSGMKIVEHPMSYEERVGESKLNVFRDGLRFLRAIVEGVLWYRPERLFLLAFAACFLVATLMAAYPIEFYLREQHLEEWMIYRFIACSLLGSAGFILLAAGTLAHRFVMVSGGRRSAPRFWPSVFELLFGGWTFVAFVTSVVAVSVLLVASGIIEYLTTGHVTLHWSRVMVAAFGFLVAFIASVTATLLQVFAVRTRSEDVLTPIAPSPQSARTERPLPLASSAVR